jgi:signal transduction histidine kinase
MNPSDSHDITVSQANDAVQGALAGLEHQLHDLERQVLGLQRMASLGTVSAMLAHEFNNVLTPIVSYCQYALHRDDPALTRTAVEKTLKNAQRLTLLCTRILGMAVDEQMGSRPTPLASLVRDTILCLGRDLEKDNITLTVEVAEELSARAHAASLQQVLFNLVINARQAMLGAAGRLTISGARTADGRVALHVADTGCGIRAEHIDRIFEPFFTTKGPDARPDRGGVGLGLHVCRRLMAEQEGEISVRSQPGQGTTFTLTLPAAD